MANVSDRLINAAADDDLTLSRVVLESSRFMLVRAAQGQASPQDMLDLITAIMPAIEKEIEVKQDEVENPFAELLRKGREAKQKRREREQVEAAAMEGQGAQQSVDDEAGVGEGVEDR
jgi:hypothetical protein